MPRTFPTPLGALHPLDDLHVLVVVDCVESPVTASGLTTTSTVGDLAISLELSLDLQHPLLIDGIRVAATDRLIDTPIRHGSVLEVDATSSTAPGCAPRNQPATTETAIWLTGPDAGHAHPLTGHTITVGSSRHADISVDDPRLPTHHGHFIRDSGAVRYEGFGLGASVRSADGASTPEQQLVLGESLVIGSSLVTIGVSRSATPPARPNRQTAAWTEPIHRERQQPDNSMAPLDVPPLDAMPTRHSTGLLTTALTVLAGLVLAVVIRQPLMVVMVAVGAVAGGAAGFGTWRRQRKERREHDELQQRRLVEFAAGVSAHHQVARCQQRNHLDLVGAVQAIADGTIWQRRSHGTLTTVLGYGDLVWQPTLSRQPAPDHTGVVSILNAHAHLRDVPVTVHLTPGDVLAIVGTPSAANSVARGLIVTLASTFGAADWVLDIDTSTPTLNEDEQWMTWLPQARHHHQLDATDGRCIVVVTHDVAGLAVRSTPLRERLHSDHPPIVIVVVPPGHTAPAVATSTLELHLDGSASLLTRHAPLPQRLRFCGLSSARAWRAGAGLSRFTDPEASETSGIPKSLRLSTLLNANGIPDSCTIADAWTGAGSDPDPRAVIGAGAGGPISIDLVADGPHALIAGTTGAGKSEFLRTLVLSLAYFSPPEALNFVLIDYKGGSAFDRCTALPHTVGVVTDLDDQLAERVLVSLEAELRHRERALRTAGASDLSEYRASPHGVQAPMARVVVVIDEFATLAAELHDFVPALVGIAQRGRSLGIHLVLATQRPAGAMSDDIRANTNLRFALRVHDTADSIDVIGDTAAASIGRTSPGRGVLRLGASDLVAMQTASTCLPFEPRSHTSGLRTRHGWMGPNATPTDQGRIREVDVLVERLGAAHAIRHGQDPRPLWLAPLTEELDQASIADADSFGHVDHPAAQRIEPLRWDREAGHLIVAGSLGSGCSTTLHTVALGLASRHGVDDLHIAAIDSTSTGMFAELERLPHTIASVSAADRTSRRRLLRRITRRIDGGEDNRVPTVVFIDGINALRTELLAAPDHGELEDLERILAEGPAAGVVVAASCDQPSGLPLSLMSRASARWCLRLSDPLEALSLGVPSTMLHRATPPGRGVDAETGRSFQLARVLNPAEFAATVVTNSTAATTGTARHKMAPLPSAISANDLIARVNGDIVEVGVGFAMSSERIAEMSLASGEHALVAGTARSGRTTLLAAIAAQWARLSPTDATLLVVAPRTPEPFRRLGIEPVEIDEAARVARCTTANTRLLLLVDDADQVIDHGDQLRDLLQQSRSSLSVIGTARTDRLREQWGHWSLGLRTHSVGVLLGCLNEVEADLFACRLPDYTKLNHATRRSFFFSRGEAEELLPVSVVAQ